MTDRVLEFTRGDVDLVSGRTTFPGRVRLTERECALLARLALRPGEAVERDELERVIGATGPGAVRMLNQTIHRLRLKLEVDAARPHHVISVFNIGYRFEALRPGPTALVDVPPEIGSWVGREAELGEAGREVRRCRLVTLCGAGGVGKTVLAVRVARRSPFVRAVFVDLAGARSGAELAAGVARALDLPTVDAATERQIVDRCFGALVDAADTLLILDNVEQLGAWITALASRILADLPRISVLVTSRAALGVEGEHVLRLGPLEPAAAVRLWCDRARAADAPVDPDDPVISALVHRLDRVPLNIELAAARARTLTPAKLLALLDDPLRVLVVPGHADRRHGSLRATLQWSWDLLGSFEQALLQRMAVFPVAARTEVLVAVLGPDADTGLAALADASMVTEVAGLWSLSESVREFVADRPDPTGGVAQAQVAHARHYAAWAGQVLGDGPVGPERLDGLDAELPNLLVVGRIAEREPELAVAVARKLFVRYRARGPVEPFVALLDQLVRAVVEPPVQAEVRWMRAVMRRLLGSYREALEDGEAAAGAGGDRAPIYEGERASVFVELGRFSEAREVLERTVDRVTEPMARAVQQANLAGVLVRLGHLGPEVERLLGEALATAGQCGEPWQEACFRMDLGTFLQQVGRLDQAQDELAGALPVILDHGGTRRAAFVRMNLAAVAAERGRLAEAEALLDEADLGFLRTGRVGMRAMVMLYRAQLRIAAGDPEEGLRLLAEVEVRSRTLDHPWLRSRAQLDATVAHALLGRTAEARDALATVSPTLLPAPLLDLAGAHVALAEARELEARGEDARTAWAVVRAAAARRGGDGGERQLRTLLVRACRGV